MILNVFPVHFIRKGHTNELKFDYLTNILAFTVESLKDEVDSGGGCFELLIILIIGCRKAIRYR